MFREASALCLPWKLPSRRLSTLWVAGAEHFMDIIADSHNVLLGRHCFYLIAQMKLFRPRKVLWLPEPDGTGNEK